MAYRIVSFMALAILSLPAIAQQNGNLPQIRQSTGDLITFGNAFPNGVLNGNMVVGTACWEAPSGTGVAISSCSDANGIVPTITLGSMATNTNCTSNPFDTECDSQMFWGAATSTGVPKISCTGTFPRQAIETFEELVGNLAFDASSTGSTAGANTSINVTSTQQNDLVVDSACRTPGFQNAPATSQNAVGDSNVSDLNLQAADFLGGAAGTLTGSWLNVATGTTLNAAAFKPTAITIATTKMPDGGKSTAYDAKLKAYGGSGSYTWSVTAGSIVACNLSLNASTGEITGTPTGVCTNPITFHVTDGTNSANANLSITIATTLQTIGTPVCSGFSTVPSSVTVNAKLNDAALLTYKGDSRHGNTAYLTSLVDITDSFGDSYFRSIPIAGGQAGAIQIDSTTTLASGVLTPTYTSLGGSPLAGFICDIPGAQQVVDDPVINQSIPGAVASPVSLGPTSITTTVPNEIILGMQTIDCLQGGGGSCTMTATCRSPFVQVATFTGFAGVPFTVCQLAAPTAGTYSLTSDFSDTTSTNMALDTPMQTLVAFRPAVPSNAPTAGEKQRRRMY